jgi:hypothetical protein
LDKFYTPEFGYLFRVSGGQTQSHISGWGFQTSYETPNDCDPWGAQTPHGSIINVCMGDGRVIAVSSSTNGGYDTANLRWTGSWAIAVQRTRGENPTVTDVLDDEW